MAFENLNSLENLNIQNNKLTSIPEDIMEPIMDTLRVVDIMGEWDQPPDTLFGCIIADPGDCVTR